MAPDDFKNLGLSFESENQVESPQRPVDSPPEPKQSGGSG